MKDTKQLRAAIYARKSTDDSERHDDNKSVTRQVAHARGFAKKRGWTVSDEHVFVDDNVSGALFKRPGLLRLLNHLKEFDVIVMSEHSRLGREQTQLAKVLADIYAKGRRVYFYLTNEELRFDSAVDKFMVSAVSFASELEREKAAQRARDALQLKAQRGWNTGGRVFGYDNIWVLRDGSRLPAQPGAKKPPEVDHTEYKVNEVEAEIVQAIFTMRRDGHGLKSIAKALNADPEYRAASEKYFHGRRIEAPRKGSGSWAPSGIRTLLANPRYRGTIPWGKYRKKIDVSESRKTRIRQDDFHQVEAPHLRIIDNDTWHKVQATLRPQHARQRTEPGENKKRMNGGRRGWGAPSPYLLSSMAQCPECGASMVVTTKSWGSGSTRRRVAFYRCSWNLSRGSTVCKNSHAEPVDAINRRVLTSIEEAVLSPAALKYVVEKATAAVHAEKLTKPDRRATIKHDIERKRRSLEKFISAFGENEDVSPQELIAEIEKRKVDIAALELELANAEPVVLPTAAELRRIRKELRKQASRFKRTLRGNVTGARAALRELLIEPLKFHPVVRDGKRAFRFEGRATIGALLDPLCVHLASPRGFEPRLPP